MIESEQKSHLYLYYKRKLVLLFSAMRHYAAKLRNRGLEVDYHALEKNSAAEIRTIKASAQQFLETLNR